MKLPKYCTLIGLVMGFSMLAQAAPTSFVYEGLLQDSAGVPIATTSTLTLAIYDPSLSCLLYEESQNVLPSSDGSFSVLVGSSTGSAKRTGSDPSLTMDKIFSAGTVRGSGAGNCVSGYIANISDARKLVISVNGTPLSPAIDLTSAPFAINAEQSEKVGAYDPSKLLRSDGAATVAALNDAKVTLLMNLLNGSLSTPANGGDAANKTYVDSQVGAKLDASASFGGDISGTYSAISVNKIRGYSVSGTAPTTNQVLKWDGTAWAPSSVSLSINASDVTTALGFTPINGQVTTTGEANKILSLDGSAHATTYGVKIKGTTSGGVFLGTNANGAAYNLILPSTMPNSGQSLQADGAGNLSWVNPTVGVTSVSVQPPLSVVNGSTTPEISLANGSNSDPFLKWNGSAWVNSKLNLMDLRSSVGPSYVQQFPTTCTSSETLAWSSPSDKFDCVQIKLNNMASVTTAVITVYVRNDGNDISCNGGTDNSAAGAPNCAFATIQGALKNIPDIIRHNVNVKISTPLSNPVGSRVLAVIDKIISASDVDDGPMLTIEGHSAVQTISNSEATASGFLIMKQSRGVKLSNLNINNFTDTAIDNNGGVLMLEGITLNNNRRGLAVSGGGMAMFMSLASNIYNSSSFQSTGISIGGGSRVSTSVGLYIDIGNYQDSRGIEAYEGEFSLENGITATIAETGGSSQNITGIEIGNSGKLYVCNTCTLNFNMSNSNMYSTALSVRGGALSSQGNLDFNSGDGAGLVCDVGASCQIYGPLIVNAVASFNRPIVVRNQSHLVAYHNFNINSAIGFNDAGVDVSNNSSFVFSPMSSGRTLGFTNGATGGVAIRLKDSSSFSVENFPITLQVNASLQILSAKNGSRGTINVSSVGGGMLTNDIVLDESSSFKAQNYSAYFMATKRACEIVNTSSVGKGPSSFCMDVSNNTATSYPLALTNCANKNMSLCSVAQYAAKCSEGTSFSTSWTKEVTDVTCSGGGTFNSTANSSFSSSYNYRCCQ